MSPRAAVRLERLGFTQVYDYVAGKKDWLAADLPVAGDRADQARAGDVARREPLTCRPDTRLATLEQTFEDAETCVVTDENGVVHGRIEPGAVRGADPDATVEEVMESGPITIRPYVGLRAARHQLREADLDSMLVTTGLGELLGVLYGADLEELPE